MGTGGGVALTGRRATTEDCVADKALRVWNGGREHNGMSIRYPVDLTGNQWRRILLAGLSISLKLDWGWGKEE